jgi:hypothetical protein
VRESEREEAWRARAEALAAQNPFDLSNDLPMRGELLALSPREHVLFVAATTSLGRLVAWCVLPRALRALRSLRVRAADPLPEPSIQYGDYARWQRASLTSDTLRDPLAYWSERLASTTACWSCPRTDRVLR